MKLLNNPVSMRDQHPDMHLDVLHACIHFWHVGSQPDPQKNSEIKGHSCCIRNAGRDDCDSVRDQAKLRLQDVNYNKAGHERSHWKVNIIARHPSMSTNPSEI